MSRRGELGRVRPATELDRAFEELSAYPDARRVYCSANVIAIAMRTLAAEWDETNSRALRDRVPGLIAAAEAWEAETAKLMHEVAR